jgi:predicted nucleic acid-binding protein
LVPIEVTTADYERMAELVELYADWPLGGTDASVIAIAERLGVTKVATLDRRHFGTIQPHGETRVIRRTTTTAVRNIKADRPRTAPSVS